MACLRGFRVNMGSSRASVPRLDTIAWDAVYSPHTRDWLVAWTRVSLSYVTGSSPTRRAVTDLRKDGCADVLFDPPPVDVPAATVCCMVGNAEAMVGRPDQTRIERRGTQDAASGRR